MGSLQNRSSTRSSFAQPRRAACTHITLTRLYGPYRCIHCHRTSRLGWVYHCTQDHDGHLSESQDTNERTVVDTLDTDLDEKSETSILDSLTIEFVEKNEDERHGIQLSAWIEEAIKKGYYTPNQIVLLRAQKRKVNRSIIHAEQTPPFRVKTHSAHPPKPASDYDPSSKLQLLSIDGSPDIPKSDLPKTTNDTPSKAPLFLKCTYKCCQNCRPSSRDRAWQYFGDVFASSEPIPTIDFSKDNRPISKAGVLRCLSIHKKRPVIPEDNSIDVTAINKQRYVTPKESKYDGKTYPPTQRIGKVEPGATNQSVREGVKRVFHGMIMSRRRPSRSSKSSKGSKKGKFRAEQEDVEEMDLALRRNHTTDAVLSDAVCTELPEDDGTSWLDTSEGEVIVGDGVAVTEEAIDLGTADIIMSV